MKNLYVVVLFLTISLMSCTKDDEPDFPLQVMQDISSMSQFNQVTGEGVSIIFFHSPTCSQCKKLREEMTPLLSDRELENVFFGEVNFHQSTEVVENNNIVGFPTLLLIKNGVEEDRMIGANHSSGKLKNRLIELLD